MSYFRIEFIVEIILVMAQCVNVDIRKVILYSGICRQDGMLFYQFE